jgi:L-threonylcarbamoyladenylate synthase
VRILTIDPVDPRSDRVAGAAAVLARGDIVALPTETFYGLAVDGCSPDALPLVNRLKGKPDEAPVLLLLADLAQAEAFCDTRIPRFHKLAEVFWPGPLTLVVPLSPSAPADPSGGRGTVAVRVPGLALPRRLAAELGRPLSGVSANRTGAPPCRTASEVAEVFGQDLGMILDGGPTPGGASSTLLDLTSNPPRILREGKVPRTALRPFVPELIVHTPGATANR